MSDYRPGQRVEIRGEFDPEWRVAVYIEPCAWDADMARVEPLGPGVPGLVRWGLMRPYDSYAAVHERYEPGFVEWWSSLDPREWPQEHEAAARRAWMAASQAAERKQRDAANARTW